MSQNSPEFCSKSLEMMKREYCHDARCRRPFFGGGNTLLGTLHRYENGRFHRREAPCPSPRGSKKGPASCSLKTSEYTMSPASLRRVVSNVREEVDMALETGGLVLQ